MAIFNVNQNRQFYVVKAVKADTVNNEGKVTAVANLDTEGDIKMGKTKDGQIFFKHLGKGGLTRTDLIDVDKVSYVKLTANTDMQRKPKMATVTLSEDVNGGKPIAGQDYILRIQINNFLSPGDACVYIKSNAVHATKAMVTDPSKFYKAMKESLERNFKREGEAGMNLLTFEVPTAGTSLVIREVTKQPWRLGVLSQDPVNFEVTATTVKYDGEDVIWATLNDKGIIPVVEDTDATPVGNGKQVADLEYFCQAERGDMFRNMGWPNNIDVKYMVDPEKEYSLIDLHYYYSGDGVQVHKSEKDITFAIASTDTDVLTALKNAITGAGITIKE